LERLREPDSLADLRIRSMELPEGSGRLVQIAIEVRFVEDATEELAAEQRSFLSSRYSFNKLMLD
jgi:hypothetical protein